MSAREMLQQLKQEIESYRNLLYQKYTELYSLVEDKQRAIVDTFSQYATIPEFDIRYMLGRKVITHKDVVVSAEEPTISWTGKTQLYTLPKTIRTYELIATPMFEFDPVVDTEYLRDLVKSQNLLPIRAYFYARFEHDTFPEPTQEDVMFQYVICDTVYDLGTIEYDIPWTAYFASFDGKVYRVSSIKAGSKLLYFFWSKNTLVYFAVYFGDIDITDIDTNETFTDSGFLIQPSHIEVHFGPGSKWMFGTHEISGHSILVRSRGMSPDIIQLYDLYTAQKLAQHVQRVSLLANISYPSLVFSGVGIHNIVRRVIKTL
ncbi:MAG: hypothetical protein QXH21_09735 [Ignisphaera sp.]